MTNYEKLVEALRILQDKNSLSYYKRQVCKDAADAIEKLVTLYEKTEMDATNLTGKLAQAEAEVERLKDSNEELREKQTYIDHYGAEWMTSAKDVPTAAYKHGYADGRDEAEAQLPKRGEIVRCGECAHCYAEGFVHERNICEKHPELGNVPDDWYCADGEREVLE